MLGLAEGTFFFQQKREKRFQQRRVRKYDDTQSGVGVTFHFGDRPEGDATSVFGGGAASVKSFASRGTVGGGGNRRVSIAETHHLGITLPKVDPTGPHLVTAPHTSTTIPEEPSSLSERKLNLLKEFEDKKEPSRVTGHPYNSAWNLNEAKFVSTGILNNLGKKFTALETYEGELTLPQELSDSLLQTHEQIVADTVVEKREWQTDCYLDYKPKNTLPFLTGVPSDPAEHAEHRALVESSVSSQKNKLEDQKKQKEKEEQQQQQQQQQRKRPQCTDGAKVGKRVRMSSETKSDLRPRASPERPHTARSNASIFSIKSDLSDDGRDSTVTTDYDRLPAELQPSILHYRRESMVPKMRRMEPQTRLEKRKAHEEKSRLQRQRALRKERSKRPPSASPKKAEKGEKKRPATARVGKADIIPRDSEHVFVSQLSQIPKTTINFSVEKTNEDDQDWLVLPSDSKDPEAQTLRMWDRKLKELHRKREESDLMDKKRGADKPMVIKFYNETQIRTLRSKHQRSATVPLPNLFKKLPPSIGKSFATPSVANEAQMIGNPGYQVFVLTLPDGSGYCNYASGRQAISQTRCDKEGPLSGSRGLYTLVFDDVEKSSLLAYFTPTGKACCYYKEGGIRMLSDSKGGCLYSEEGVVTKRWEWPHPRLKLPITISIYLNVHISFRCSNLSNMDLRISSRGHSYKFPVGPSSEDLELFKADNQDLSNGALRTSCTFFSKAAKSRASEVTVRFDTRKKPLQKKKSTQLLLGESHTKVTDPLSDLLAEGQRYADALDTFRSNVSGIVNKWMQHYCRTIGIGDQDDLGKSKEMEERPPFQTRFGKSEEGLRGRLVKSSMGYNTDLSRPSSTTQLRRTRSLTHPLFSRPGSRVDSPLRPFLVPGHGDGSGTPPHATSPFRRSPTPLHHHPPSSMSELQSRPSRVGVAKAASRGSSKPAVGCPVALHNMFWKKLQTMPSCKCDKRRVPFIFDMEYDVFLLSHVPRDQLIVVCIVSSLKERSCSCEPMIDAIYTHQNRLHFAPCMQSCHDPYRLLKYDLSNARAGMKNPEDTPLLVERHNASPGMFLMYMGGKLVYADYMFNGYSTTKRDFTKQIEVCIAQGKRGQFLPYNFKFTKRTGTKILSSNAWAYNVPGFMQDLIPASPQSDSHSTSRISTPVPENLGKSGRSLVGVAEGDSVTDISTSQLSMSQITMSLSTSQFKISQTA